MIKFKELLKEIQAQDTYGYALSENRPNRKVYTFRSDENTYLVIFKLDLTEEYADWSFRTQTGDFNDETNEGNMMKVVRTNMAIIDDVLETTDKTGIVYRAESRRNAIYKRYFQRLFPNSEIREQGRTTFVKIK